MPNDDYLPPRRNARSFDLDDSAAKAAAWVWHLHASKPEISTEGRFISSQRRRSSSNFDRKATRFQQEASTTTNTAQKKETPMWDCGSNLYDTFELVSFGNRLDRSLMETVPITPPQAHPQEHQMKSSRHEPNRILRTLSLPRSLSPQACKNHEAIASPHLNKFKVSKSHNNRARASSTGSAQKASTKWSRMEKLMNVIKKVVVLHKQVSFMGCKRSTNIIECSQRPLDLIDERKGNHELLGNENLSTRNIRDISECMGDEFSMQYTKTGKIRASSSESLGSGLASKNAKIRSNSGSMSDGILGPKKIRPRRRSVGDDELVFMDRFSVKGGDLEGVDVIKESANEYVDHYKHLHHHHHHHHHHHYLHHKLASESARLSPETLSQICAEQSWLI